MPLPSCSRPWRRRHAVDSLAHGSSSPYTTAETDHQHGGRADEIATPGAPRPARARKPRAVSVLSSRLTFHHRVRGSDEQCDVGRPFRQSSPDSDHGGDQCLDRLRSAPCRPGHRAAPRRTPPCWPRTRHHLRRTTQPRSTDGSRPGSRAKSRRAPSRSSASLEDIHMNVESRLAEIIGEAAGRLHTARSRNDQVALDFRLWVRDTVDALDAGTARPADRRWPKRRFSHAEAVMPGFTHLQSAQPVTLGHHLLAYVEMIGRDRGRFCATRGKRMNESSAGRGGACRHLLPDRPARRSRRSARLRPARPHNSLDSGGRPRLRAGGAVGGFDLRRASLPLRRGDRAMGDAAVRLRGAFRQVLDRIVDHAAETTIRMPPSSYAARPAGSSATLTGLLIVMKGLPLAYSKDMQEDKEGTFDALDALVLMIAATMAGMVRDLKPDLEADGGGGRHRLQPPRPTSPIGWCAKLGLPFRQAHHVTGRIVAAGRRARCTTLEGSPTRSDAGHRTAGSPPRSSTVLGVRQLGRKPHELRRNGARQRAGAGRGLAGEAEMRPLSDGLRPSMDPGAKP